MHVYLVVSGSVSAMQNSRVAMTYCQLPPVNHLTTVLDVCSQ